MANSNVDLNALTVRRAPVAQLQLPRRWFSRVLAPVGLLTGFAALFVYASWDTLRPARGVRIVPVVVSSGAVEPSGQELFKANGWIEPRPLPVDVPVQTEGMYRVIEVLVVPGDRVQLNQLLLKLDDVQARLALDAVTKQREKKRAMVRSARADVTKVEVALANANAAIGLAKEESAAEVRSLEADAAKSAAALKGAELAVAVEEDLRKSGVTVSELKLRQAQLRRDEARAEVQSAAAKVEKANTLATVKVRQMELARAAADADLASIRAKLVEAEQAEGESDVAIRQAQLEIDRTRITAPCAGVVMQLNVRVGSILGGKNTAVEHKDAAVTLYDPAKLQVRVEVPLGKFALVRPGQPAVIEIDDVLPGTKLAGRVLSDTHFANVARNSVPVKVALPDNPPSALRPEMIAAVRFLAPPNKSDQPTVTQRLLMPRRLVQFDGDKARAWVLSAGNRAELRDIELAPGEKNNSGETVAVTAGLNAADKLIASELDQLKPGDRVRASGEER